MAGQLLALLVFVELQAALPEPELKAWGWRVPFLRGALGALVAPYLRRTMVESADRRAGRAKDAGSLRALWRHKRAVLLTFVFTAFGSLNFYIFTSYMQNSLVISADLSAQVANAVITTALVLFMLAQPLFGTLADRVGLRAHMLAFTGLSAVCTVPILTALQGAADPVWASALVFAGLMIPALYAPIAGLLKADMFPASVRALGVGLPYALANATFGGTAEYAALLMPDLRRHGHLDGDGAVETNIGRRAA